MKRGQIVAIHLVFWITFVIIPFFMFSFGGFRLSPETYYFMIQNVFNAIVFYLAYFFIIPFIIKRYSLVTLLSAGLTFLVVFSLTRFTVNPSLKEWLGAFQRWPVSNNMSAFYAFFWTLMFSFYAVIIYLSIEWFRERRRRFELVREKQKSEIDLLKSQMNPHFMMNTLNNLYSLVYSGSGHASDAVIKLSDIMRYMLYETHDDYVPLESEIKYLRSYIDLQLLRYSNKDFIEIETEGDPTGRMIAPMLLVPFVENAFKHGNKNLPGMGISIRLSIEEERIIFNVSNFKAAKNINKVNESGVGLNNITKRLELQYPDKHLLEITDGLDHFNVHLILET